MRHLLYLLRGLGKPLEAAWIPPGVAGIPPAVAGVPAGEEKLTPARVTASSRMAQLLQSCTAPYERQSQRDGDNPGVLTPEWCAAAAEAVNPWSCRTASASEGSRTAAVDRSGLVSACWKWWDAGKEERVDG